MAFAACPVFIKQWMTTTVVAGTAMWRTRVRFAYGWGSYGFGVFQLGSIQDKSFLDLSAKITSALEPGSESTVRVVYLPRLERNRPKKGAGRGAQNFWWRGGEDLRHETSGSAICLKFQP